MQKFCLNIIKNIPHFNFWFLSSDTRAVLYYSNSREHFVIKNLVVNSEPAWPLNRNEATYYLKPEGYEKDRKNQKLGGG